MPRPDETFEFDSFAECINRNPREFRRNPSISTFAIRLRREIDPSPFVQPLTLNIGTNFS
jgi:hypothetical protein